LFGVAKKKFREKPRTKNRVGSKQRLEKQFIVKIPDGGSSGGKALQESFLIQVCCLSPQSVAQVEETGWGEDGHIMAGGLLQQVPKSEGGVNQVA